MITAGRVPVATSATPLHVAMGTTVRVIVSVPSGLTSGSIEVGGVDVAPGTGFALAAGVVREFMVAPGDRLYAANNAGVGTVSVSVLALTDD